MFARHNLTFFEKCGRMRLHIRKIARKNVRNIHKFDIFCDMCYTDIIREHKGGIENERLCFRLY